MKVLIVSNIFPPDFIGGYELRALDIGDALHSSGHTVRVLTSAYLNDDNNQLGYLDIRRELYCPWFINDRLLDSQQHSFFAYLYSQDTIQKLAGNIISFKPDIILLFNTVGLGTLGIYSFIDKINIPTIQVLGDNVFSSSEYATRFNKHFNIDYNKIMGIPNSHKLVEEIEKTVGTKYTNYEVLPCWFSTLNNNLEYIESDKVKFIFASTIHLHKGIKNIIEAAIKLIEKNITNFKIDMYGHGKYSEQLQKDISNNHLENFISYHGSLPNQILITKMHKYEAMILPTWYREPFAKVIAEGASQACFPIMTGTVGVAGYFLDGIDCSKIKATSNDLAQAMQNFIELDYKQRLKIRAKAQETAEKYFYFPNIFKQILQILENNQQSYQKNPEEIRNAEIALTKQYNEFILEVKNDTNFN